MRYTQLIFLLIALVPISAWAQTIGEDEARQRASRFFRQKNTEVIDSQPQLAYTAKAEEKTCFYIYNNGNKGFVIIGGDKVAHEVLG